MLNKARKLRVKTNKSRNYKYINVLNTVFSFIEKESEKGNYKVCIHNTPYTNKVIDENIKFLFSNKDILKQLRNELNKNGFKTKLKNEPYPIEHKVLKISWK